MRKIVGLIKEGASLEEETTTNEEEKGIGRGIWESIGSRR